MKVVYDVYSGKICGIVECPDSCINSLRDGLLIEQQEDFIDAELAVDSDIYYVLLPTMVITTRPDMVAALSSTNMLANGIDTVTSSNLPIPCTITIDDTTYTVDDGIFEFTTDLAGTYTIKAEAFPYLPKEWEVTAV